MHRDGPGVEDDAHAAGLGQLRGGLGQTVRQVDGGRRRPAGRDQPAAAQARRRPLVAVHAVARGEVEGVTIDAGLEHGEAGGGGADRSRDVELVAGAAAAATKDAAGSDGPERGDVDHEGPRRPREVAADEYRAFGGGRRHDAVDEVVEIRERQVRRQHEAEEDGARRRAHRRQVAEVDHDGLQAERAGAGPGAPEVHALDEAVGGEDIELAAFGLNDRGVVADADVNPGGRRTHARPKALDERALVNQKESPLCRVGSSHEPAKTGGAAM